MKLDITVKGVPPLEKGPLDCGHVGAQRWNLLRGDLPLPVLVLKDDAFQHNLAILKRMAERHGVSLAPHGKTSMCPDLFDEQMGAGGCWGISAATVQQAAVMARHGVPRLILANQVTGRTNVRLLADLKRHYPKTVVFSFVDSAASLDELVKYGGEGLAPSDRFRVMIELGHANGRTGCRSMEALRAVADHAHALSGAVVVTGISFYEGTITINHGENAWPTVGHFMKFVREGCDYLLPRIQSGTEKAIVTGGGSAFFDIVLDELGNLDRQRTEIVLRGACYFTGDHGYYAEKLLNLDLRETKHARALGMRGSDIKPALEIFSLVQSLNDPGTAIMTMGIRDIPFDLGYPKPLRQYRSGREIMTCDSGWAITNSNDQHAYLRYPLSADLAVGDMFSFGISHPCTAFDKWRMFYRVDDDYNVLKAHTTFF